MNLSIYILHHVIVSSVEINLNVYRVKKNQIRNEKKYIKKGILLNVFYVNLNILDVKQKNVWNVVNWINVINIHVNII